ncbi:MAG: BatD family protein, partial [Candidatus Avelusimicrobium sp.]
MKKIFLFLSLLLSASVWAAAQVTLTASVDKNTLTLDDEITLSVRVAGASGNVIMPQLPSLPAFNVYSQEMEQSTINGNTTLEFRYVLLPRFAGQATIGAVTFKHNGKTYKTAPISIRIYRNAQSLPAAQQRARV